MTAKVCTKCREAKGIADFHAQASRCKKCANEATKLWYRENKDRQKANRLAWNSRHENLPFHRQKAHLKNRYGITPERLEEMRAEQGNSCAICAETFTGTPHVDHCHESKVVRGLLCNFCNRGLGLFRDSPERLELAAAYLRDRAR